MNVYVSIKNYYPAFIAVRSSIIILKEQIKFEENKSYVFDFMDISFISRSFADEFLKFLNNSKINYKITHANMNITAILNAVKQSYNCANNDYDPIAITAFKDQHDLFDFLATI